MVLTSGMSPGAGKEKLAVGVLLLGASGLSGQCWGRLGPWLWVAGMSLLSTPSSPVSCSSLVSAVARGTWPACHVGVESPGMLPQTLGTCLDLPANLNVSSSSTRRAASSSQPFDHV